MSRVRPAGTVFVTRVGDHPHQHVHVHDDGSFVVERDLDRRQAMEGAAPTRTRNLLAELVEEGLP